MSKLVILTLAMAIALVGCSDGSKQQETSTQNESKLEHVTEETHIAEEQAETAEETDTGNFTSVFEHISLIGSDKSLVEERYSFIEDRNSLEAYISRDYKVHGQSYSVFTTFDKAEEDAKLIAVTYTSNMGIDMVNGGSADFDLDGYFDNLQLIYDELLSIGEELPVEYEMSKPFPQLLENRENSEYGIYDGLFTIDNITVNVMIIYSPSNDTPWQSIATISFVDEKLIPDMWKYLSEVAETDIEANRN